MSCASLPSTLTTAASTSTSILSSFCPRVRHILSGTFNTPNLHLLSYDTINHSLVIEKSIAAKGPHQFLALGQGKENGRGEKKRRVYATTWAMPPKISSWEVVGLGGGEEELDIRFINEKDISEWNLIWRWKEVVCGRAKEQLKLSLTLEMLWQCLYRQVNDL